MRPAGSGKSVLVRLWAQSVGLPEQVAWVSVERGQRDGPRFWLSVIDALSQVCEFVEPVSPAPDFRGELAVEQRPPCRRSCGWCWRRVRIRGLAHRLRLAGQLTELGAPDLRFSLEETEELLRTAGITLSDGGVALLYERTAGWAAGLRLAATSLARHPDPERFVTEGWPIRFRRSAGAPSVGD